MSTLLLCFACFMAGQWSMFFVFRWRLHNEKIRRANFLAALSANSEAAKRLLTGIAIAASGGAVDLPSREQDWQTTRDALWHAAKGFP